MPESTPSLSVSLYQTNERSDKEYHLQLNPRADGFVVEFRNGARGATMRARDKTPTPVAYAVAAKLFHKTVAEKLRDGYTECESGAAYQGTENVGRISGVLPQLCNSIEQDVAHRLLCDPSWGLQQKHDGERRLLRIAGGDVTGINRKGLSVPLPLDVESDAKALNSNGGLLLDGEMVGTELWVWDVLEHDGVDVTALPLSARIVLLEQLSLTGSLRTVSTFRTAAEKEHAIAHIRATGGEGFVLKLLAGRYVPGRPASGGDVLKVKFTAAATARVSRINAGKRSVGLEVRDAAEVWVDVGNVTVPPNAAIPDEGAIIEVEYLYAYRGGSLFQPVYRGQRFDQDESDCFMSQLQYKGVGADANAVQA
jgi:bifunctional non-homologous end joining protein LigD